MHKGSPDTGVSQGQRVSMPLLQGCILCTPRSMAVGGSGLVQHKGHSEEGERSGRWPVLGPTHLPIQFPPPPLSHPRKRIALPDREELCCQGQKILDMGPEVGMHVLALLFKPSFGPWQYLLH